MQKAHDRQRLLQVHGALLSDDRLPLVVTNLRRTSALDGRVLCHGEDDSGRQYMLLEGTDAQIHFIYHTADVSAAWGQGKLRPNSFARFRRLFDDGRPIVETTDLGDADRLLKNMAHFRSNVAAGRQQFPTVEGPWSGWLGKYVAAIARARNESAVRNQGNARRNAIIER